jgi:hypothetical protein
MPRFPPPFGKKRIVGASSLKDCYKFELLPKDELEEIRDRNLAAVEQFKSNYIPPPCIQTLDGCEKPADPPAFYKHFAASDTTQAKALVWAEARMLELARRSGALQRTEFRKSGITKCDQTGLVGTVFQGFLSGGGEYYYKYYIEDCGWENYASMIESNPVEVRYWTCPGIGDVIEGRVKAHSNIADLLAKCRPNPEFEYCRDLLYNTLIYRLPPSEGDKARCKWTTFFRDSIMKTIEFNPTMDNCPESKINKMAWDIHLINGRQPTQTEQGWFNFGIIGFGAPMCGEVSPRSGTKYNI